MGLPPHAVRRFRREASRFISVTNQNIKFLGIRKDAILLFRSNTPSDINRQGICTRPLEFVKKVSKEFDPLSVSFPFINEAYIYTRIRRNLNEKEAIHMGKPVGPRSGQMVHKIQDS